MTEKEYLKLLNDPNNNKNEQIYLEIIYEPEVPYSHPPECQDNVTYYIPERFRKSRDDGEN